MFPKAKVVQEVDFIPSLSYFDLLKTLKVLLNAHVIYEALDYSAHSEGVAFSLVAHALSSMGAFESQPRTAQRREHQFSVTRLSTPY